MRTHYIQCCKTWQVPALLYLLYASTIIAVPLSKSNQRERSPDNKMYTFVLTCSARW